jgi:crotonobetainyl-CoA:carnitine CoA-transferase CaiB-like acyl-CoA transferase
VWPTPFGHLLIAANDRALWFMLHGAGRLHDGLPADATIAEKAAARHRLMGEWFMSFPDRASLIAELDAVNVAWGDIRTSAEAFDGDLAGHRRLSTEVDDRAGGVRRVTQSPYHFSDATSAVAGPAPHRGEHHHAVLHEWLGFTTDDVTRLERNGTLVPDLGVAPSSEPPQVSP